MAADAFSIAFFQSLANLVRKLPDHRALLGGKGAHPRRIAVSSPLFFPRYLTRAESSDALSAADSISAFGAFAIAVSWSFILISSFITEN